MQYQGAVDGKPGPAVFDKAETSVSFEMVPATVTNMSLFDRLMDNAVLRKDGVITKCMEEFVDGFQVCHGATCGICSELTKFVCKQVQNGCYTCINTGI